MVRSRESVCPEGGGTRVDAARMRTRTWSRLSSLTFAVFNSRGCQARYAYLRYAGLAVPPRVEACGAEECPCRG
jgi:hypothetical protein